MIVIATESTVHEPRLIKLEHPLPESYLVTLDKIGDKIQLCKIQAQDLRKRGSREN